MKPQSGLKCIFVLATLFLAGCSTMASVRTDDMGSKAYPKTEAAHVKIFASDDVSHRYEPIGLVVVAKDAGEDPSSVLDTLRDQAAELGADGVIDARMTVVPGYWNNGITVTGMAVRFK